MVVGRLLYPYILATSSAISAIVSISPRNVGTSTFEPLTSNSSLFKYSAISEAGISVPKNLFIFSGSKGRTVLVFLIGYISIQPPITSPAPISSISSQARFIAFKQFSESSPFSNRAEASVLIPKDFAPRLTSIGLKFALSNRTVVVVSVTSVLAPPMTPATPIALFSSAIVIIPDFSSLGCSSRVSSVSPSDASLTIIFLPSILSKS